MESPAIALRNKMGWNLFLGLVKIYKFVPILIEEIYSNIPRNMLQIRSLKHSYNQSSSSTLQSVFHSMCEKIDFQVQCKLNSSGSTSSPIKRSKENIYCNLNHTTVSKQKTIRKDHSPDNRIYLNVEIKNVNNRQEKIGKILENIALNKKCDDISLKALRKQSISIKKECEDIQALLEVPRIEITMETMFKTYLQFYQAQVKQLILCGKIYSKIIKPFLSMFERIKIDSGQLAIKCRGSPKFFPKTELYKIFNQYKPKIELQSEIEKLGATSSKFYHELYSKYDNLPIFPEQEQNQPSVEELTIKNESKIDLEDSCSDHEKLDEVQQIRNSLVNEEQTSKQRDQHLLNQRQREAQSKTDGFEARKSQLKQRFENRFKKQLKLLSDDANVILKARFQ